MGKNAIREHDFDSTPRNVNGVKYRLDDQGDAWAKEHRKQLSGIHYMQDLDAVFGHVTFGQNTGERLFLEYAPNDHDNRMEPRREFAIVAMFDRKVTRSFAFGNRSMLSRAFYMWLCRQLGSLQPVKPKFFYVVGKDTPPWEMIGIDIETGDPNGEDAILENVNWGTVWSTLGLSEMRRTLLRWLKGQTVDPCDMHF